MGRLTVLPDSTKERALRILELELPSGSGIARNSLFRFASVYRHQISRGHFSHLVRKQFSQEDHALELGHLLLRLGQPDAAIAPLKRVPLSHGSAQLYLGEALAATNRTNEAINVFEQRSWRSSELFWRHLWRAQCLLQLGDFREMERSISDAKKLKPRSPLPFLIQGRVGHLEALESAKALGPTDPWIRFTLGWTHLIQGNVTDAEKELTVGLRRARWCKWAYILRARARLRRGDVDAARQDLESALTIDPDIHATHRSWSTIDGDPEEILELNYAIHSNPNAGWLLAWRGLIYFNLLLPDQALDDFRRAVNLEPNCGWARAFLARAESLWLTTGKSITELRTAYISSPQCRWILLWQGYFNAKRGDYKAAAKNYNSVLKSHPHYALAYGWSAKLRAEMGDLTGGLLQIDLAVELDPTYGFHFERRRRILWSLDKPDAAFHDMVLAVRREGRFRWSGGQKREEDLNSHLQLDKHLRIYPHDDWALAWRGDTRLAMGNLSGALNDLNSAIALSPNEPWRRAWRGDVKLHLRDYQGALDDAELSLKGDPQYSRAWGVRARALISVHKFKEAISSLNHVINNDFGAAWAFHERAKILMQQRRYGEAIHDLQRTIALDKNNDKARKDILAAKKMSKFMAS